MKKIYFILSIVLLFLFGFMAFIVKADSQNLYDNTKISYSNGSSFAYNDISLDDGWYVLTIKGSLDNPIGFIDAQYYTDDLSTGYSFFSTEYVKNIDSSVTNTITAEIYIINGKFKIQGSTYDTFSTTILGNNGLDLYLIKMNEIIPYSLSVTSNSIVMNQSVPLLRGWYELTIEQDVIENPVPFMDLQYTTGNWMVYESVFGASEKQLVRNIDVSDGFKAEIYINPNSAGTLFGLYTSGNAFSVELANHLNINLSLVQIVPDPVFNYSELILSVPYYDIPSLEYVKSLLTAYDEIDGDLTSSIVLVDETITDFNIGDCLSCNLEKITVDSEEYNISSENFEYVRIKFVKDSVEYYLSIGQSIVIGDYEFLYRYIPENSEYRFEEISYSGNGISFFNEQSIFNLDIFDDIEELYLVDLAVTYYAKYSVSDSFGNTSELTVYFDIYDDIVSELFYEDELNSIHDILTEASYHVINFNIYLSVFNNTQEVENIIRDFQFKNYNTYEIPINFNDIHLTQLIENRHQNLWGFYYEDLTFDNQTYFGIELIWNIIDDIPPSFEDSPSRIYVSNTIEFTTAELENMLTYLDDSDDLEDLTLNLIYNNYSQNYDEVGRYKLIWELSDTSGNVSFHVLTIYVVDLTPPLYVVDDVFIVVSMHQPFESEDVEDIILAFGIIDPEVIYQLSIISENYFENSNVIGTYSMLLKFDYEDTTSEIIELTINVIDEHSSPSQLNFGLTQALLASTGLIVLLSAFVVITKKKTRI